MGRVLGRLAPLLGGALLAVAVAGVVAAACSPEPERPAATATSSRPSPAVGRPARPAAVGYLLQGGRRPAVTVRLEVAASQAARERGLMGRPRIPPGTGMVFLFPGDTTGAFWMKDTLVPLSIAFVAAGGRVVAVEEMAPCRADPCPLYAAGRPYRYAVELPAGAFAAAGVGPGDRVVPSEPERLPIAT